MNDEKVIEVRLECLKIMSAQGENASTKTLIAEAKTLSDWVLYKEQQKDIPDKE